MSCSENTLEQELLLSENTLEDNEYTDWFISRKMPIRKTVNEVQILTHTLIYILLPFKGETVAESGIRRPSAIA